MRIAKINLQAFGPFTDRPLTFSEEDGLVVLYGPNEAGKSSMLRALKAWLYGIPAQSTDNFIHDHQKMRVGGRLCLSSGRELTFLRRKGNKKTILDLSGNPLDDGILDTFLSQVGEDAFSKMFGIDNEALVRGGKELVEDKGDVGQALFAAGMSGLQLRRVLQAIEKQANELFKSGGSKQEITEALKDLTEARKKIKEECVSGKEINELEDRLHEAQASVARLDISLAEALTELSRFERLAGALPKLGKRTGILARLEVMRDVPILSEDFPERRREAQQDKKQATKDKAIYEPELERLAQQSEELSGAGGFASYAEKIESLLKRLGAHLKAQRDLVGLDAKHETCVQETQRLLAEIRPNLSLEDLGLLRVTEARKKRIRELALRRENAFSAETKCLDALTLTTEKLEQAQQKLGGMPAGRDESELERTVDTLQRHGDLAKTVRAAQQEQQAFADEAKNALARLGLWSGTLEDVERLPVPTQETIGRFQTDFDELAADRKALEKRLRDLNAERAGIEDEIEGMRRNVAVLTEVELVDARDRRDGTWRQIRGAWLDQEQLEEPASALAQGYEEEVKTADDAADTLRDNADQVAEHTERLRQLDRVQKKIVKDSVERDRIVKRQEQVEAEWAVAWSESGIKPLPPKEMQAWLNRHAQLLELGRRMREAGVEEREAVREMVAGVEALHLCMQTLGEAPCGPEETYGKTYGKLIERSKALVSSLRNMNNARAAAEKAVADIEKERRRAEKELGQAQAAWAQWQQDWAECMGWLELAPDTSINEADSHLERLDDLFKQAKDAADLADRIAGINKDAKSCGIRV